MWVEVYLILVVVLGVEVHLILGFVGVFDIDGVI